MKRVLILGALCLGFLANTSLAGVISALSKINNTDDYLSDDSLGVIVDYRTDNNPTPNTPYVGDIAFGIAKINVINGDLFDHTAYLVYSLQISSVSGTTVLHQPTPSDSPYDLNELLNLGSLLPSTAVAVVLEVTGAGSNPFTNTSKYPFGTINYMTADLTTFKDDLQSLSSIRQPLFSVGITGSPSGQYFKLTLSDDPVGEPSIVQARLMVDWAATGLNKSDFKPLNNSPPFTAAIYRVTLTLENPTFPNTGDRIIKTNDDGNYYINYVPEPSALVGLIGAALSAAAVTLRRRRKA